MYDTEVDWEAKVRFGYSMSQTCFGLTFSLDDEVSASKGGQLQNEVIIILTIQNENHSKGAMRRSKRRKR